MSACSVKELGSGLGNGVLERALLHLKASRGKTIYRATRLGRGGMSTTTLNCIFDVNMSLLTDADKSDRLLYAGEYAKTNRATLIKNHTGSNATLLKEPDWLPEGTTVLHKQPFFALDPYAGVEYKVGKALRLTLKADWMIAINSDGLNRPIGPRIYFGFIFAH